MTRANVGIRDDEWRQLWLKTNTRTDMGGMTRAPNFMMHIYIYIYIYIYVCISCAIFVKALADSHKDLLRRFDPLWKLLSVNKSDLQALMYKYNLAGRY